MEETSSKKEKTPKAMPPGVSKRAFTVPEFAIAVGISESKAWRLVTDKEVASVEIGGSRRITDRQLDEYLRKLEAAA